MDAFIGTLNTFRTALRAARRTIRVFGSSVGVTALYGLQELTSGFDHVAASRWTRRWATALTRGFDLRVQVTGEPPAGGALIVSNHRSYVDIIALGSLVDASFIAKSELASWPVLGPTFRLSNTIFVQRNAPQSGRRVRNQVEAMLRRGLSVINFAEGTTHGGTGLLPFKPGLFRTVWGMDIPIVPTTVTYRGMEERPGTATARPTSTSARRCEPTISPRPTSSWAKCAAACWRISGPGKRWSPNPTY